VQGVSLGEALAGEDDSAAAFVRRSRKAVEQREKEAAAKRVSDAAAEKARAAASTYTSRDLGGLEVGHGTDAFQSGETRILTLADRGVLDDDGKDLNDAGDMLIDVELDARERREKQAADAKKKRFDVFAQAEAMGRGDKLPSAFDDADGADTKASITLDASGSVDVVRAQRAAEIERSLDADRNGRIFYDLAKLADPIIASDTRTEDEIVAGAFKKRTKKRKATHAPTTTGDLLSELSAVARVSETESADHGSRRRKRHTDDDDDDDTRDAAAVAASQRSEHGGAYARAVAKSQRKVRGKMRTNADKQEDATTATAAAAAGGDGDDDNDTDDKAVENESAVTNADIKHESARTDNDDDVMPLDDVVDIKREQAADEDELYSALARARRAQAMSMRRTDVAASVRGGGWGGCVCVL
jgi:hypothetical protein